MNNIVLIPFIVVGWIFCGATTTNAEPPIFSGDRLKEISAEDIAEIKDLSKQVFNVFQPILISACTSEMHKDDTIIVSVYNLSGHGGDRLRRMSHVAFYPNTGKRSWHKPDEMVVGPRWFAFKNEINEVVQVNSKRCGQKWKAIAAWDGYLKPINVIGSIDDELIVNAVDYIRSNVSDTHIISISNAGEQRLKVVVRDPTYSNRGRIVTVEFKNGKWETVGVAVWVS